MSRSLFFSASKPFSTDSGLVAFTLFKSLCLFAIEPLAAVLGRKLVTVKIYPVFTAGYW